VTRKERERYHQLHPAKLAVDWGAAIIAGVLLWKRQPLAAVIVGFVPSIVVTLIFLSGRFDGALGAVRSRPLAESIALRLSARVNTLRFAGLAVSWAGCWFHVWWLIPLGVVVILVAWLAAWRTSL
jgi:hypothetical protein